MRIALASYRSKQHCGGQGVYVRNLSRELVALGHDVEVFSGPPYPRLDPGVRLTRVPSLDLYRPEDPFRRPALREFRDRIDVLEYLTMCSGGFPEPRTFGMRLSRLLADRAGDFDLLHDNQTLAPGILRIADRGLPVLTTIHHPITADRRAALAAATRAKRPGVRRWYGFVAMQRRVARRSPHVLTVSQRAAADIAADFGVPAERIRVVPVGVDTDTFRPASARTAGRVVTVASSDAPMKGMDVLIDAVRRVPPTVLRELVVVGTASPATARAVQRADLAGRVRFVSGLPDTELAELLGSAQALAVPSRYEGFSLPAVEALACATPVVASNVGALPELLGGDRRCGTLVPPGDAEALAAALAELLADPRACADLGAEGRRRVLAGYGWPAVARATAELYAEIAGHPVAAAPAVPSPAPATGPVPTAAGPAPVDADSGCPAAA
ncbi:glycosyltransferase family 4 protein [Plantactinospora siamensis]|uniref:Glycosyltransferase family 4 protein n=1 Tax=Plantactinospora siamensis TaxID=555372 RepID=A0ABV6P465_9ACTN